MTISGENKIERIGWVNRVILNGAGRAGHGLKIGIGFFKKNYGNLGQFCKFRLMRGIFDEISKRRGKTNFI